MAKLADMFGAKTSDRFLGLPGPGEAPAQIAVLGADCATPYASVGAYCAGGPKAIRAGDPAMAGDLGKLNFDLGRPILPESVRAVDLGDLPTDPGDAAGNRDTILKGIAALRAAGTVPILLGGDDSVPIPMLQAYAGEEPVTILQIDAHIDWRDAVDGESWGLSSTMRRASEMDHVTGIVQVGQRGVGSAGPAELAAAQDWGAVLVPARRLHRGGMERAIEAIPEGGRVIICLDWDALDPLIMPAVIAPTAGGLSYHQLMDLIEGVAARARIVGCALVEFMPDADREGIGARTASQVLTTLLGVVSAQCV
jgi:agmatinase